MCRLTKFGPLCRVQFEFIDIARDILLVSGSLVCLSAHEGGRSEGPSSRRPGRLQQDVRSHEEDRSGRHREAGPVQGGRRGPAPGQYRF